MVTRTITKRSESYGYGRSDVAIDDQIADAVKEFGRDPDEVLLSSTQATSSGGQNYSTTVMLIWRDPYDGRQI